MSSPAAGEGAGPSAARAGDQEAIRSWCEEVRSAVRKLRWQVDPCEPGIEWRVAGWSIEKRPLVYADFGDPSSANVTLVLTMVHGDEVTPLYLGLRMAWWLKHNQDVFRGLRVVIAPLVNPDGFFTEPCTRVNARGVDINRNFYTRDWDSRALQAWKKRFRSDPRRFPGNQPESEPETQFQRELIRMSRPQKILSIHAPLNQLDYDGPTHLSLARFPREYVRECLKLRRRLKAVSSGFFPGSLGNFAGQELGIPTLTMELPSADPTQARSYWLKFKAGIRTMIEFKVPDVAAQNVLWERVGGSFDEALELTRPGPACG